MTEGLVAAAAAVSIRQSVSHSAPRPLSPGAVQQQAPMQSCALRCGSAVPSMRPIASGRRPAASAASLARRPLAAPRPLGAPAAGPALRPRGRCAPCRADAHNPAVDAAAVSGNGSSPNGSSRCGQCPAGRRPPYCVLRARGLSREMPVRGAIAPPQGGPERTRAGSWAHGSVPVSDMRCGMYAGGALVLSQSAGCAAQRRGGGGAAPAGQHLHPRHDLEPAQVPRGGRCARPARPCPICLPACLPPPALPTVRGPSIRGAACSGDTWGGTRLGSHPLRCEFSWPIPGCVRTTRE